MASLLSPDALQRALALRDLTDPAAGRHALQEVVAAVEDALAALWGVPVHRHRAEPLVSVTDNYDRLGYPSDAVARDARYTRYVSPGLVLRTQTSALIPALLDELAAEQPVDLVLSCPGMVYRRDAIDRLHVGEPHQLDLWRVRTALPSLVETDLHAMIGAVVTAALPGHDWRTVPARHPYTLSGQQIDVWDPQGGWVEVGECGLAHPDVLARSGLDPTTSGLALGLGLDRLLMLRKGIDDIRVLRSADPRIAAQLLDLQAYRPVSVMPPVRRDLSIAVVGRVGAEELGDRVRSALGDDADAVEAVEVLSETPGNALPEQARTRLGLKAGQRNVLLRVVLRRLDRSLTAAEANALRDRIYAALHEGSPGAC